MNDKHALSRDLLSACTAGINQNRACDLLNQGADPDYSPQSDMVTSLHGMVVANWLIALRQALERTKHIDQQSKDLGETPLHKAAKLGREEAVRMLLAAGADTEVKNINGRTALHLARGTGRNSTADLIEAVILARQAQEQISRTASEQHWPRPLQ